MRISLERAFEVVPRAGARMGYDWHELRREEAQVLLRTPPEQAFFSMIGHQVRFQEATVRLREQSGRVDVHVDATLVHGPPGGPYERKERIGADWYRDFFASVATEIETSETRASEMSGPTEDEHAPSRE